MNKVDIQGSKVTIVADGKTRIFGLEAGSEIVFYMMHFFSNEQIVAGLEGTDAEKLLKHLPGYTPKQVQLEGAHICQTCLRPL